MGTFARSLGELMGTADRRRVAALAASSVSAVCLGFLLITPAKAARLITAGGYYFILALFSAFVLFAWRVVAARTEVWRPWLRRAGWAGVMVVAATLFAIWTDSFAHKILFDEYVLQGTAWHMHATKEIGTPVRAYDFGGTWLAIDAFLDKRPYFFTFLISLVHDLTGFRLANAFALNVALAAVTLSLAYWLVQTLTQRVGPALLAVGLLATLPLFGQNATGASMELHNLAMIAVVMACAILYLRAPDPDRLSLLVLGGALLAQCRYESVLFVAPVGVIVLLGWIRGRRVLLPWPAMVAPLLLVPYAWQDRFVSTKPILWQLREGETARFAWRYLSGNLDGAWGFFFATTPGRPNSLWLTLLGTAGLAWAVWRALRWFRRRPGAPWPASHIVLGWFGITVAANLALLMFYYWSRLDEPITARFALPFCFVLVLLAGWLAGWLEVRRIPAVRMAAIGLLAWVLVFGARAYARRLYTTENLVMHEMNWELEQVTSHRGPLLVITSKATMPYLLLQIPALNTPIARVRGPEIAWHMNLGTFREVLVAQVLRPTSARGQLIVDPEDELPADFHLEPIANKRFGARWVQISRLVAVAERPAATTGGQ